MTKPDSTQILWAQFAQAVADKMGKGGSVANIQTLPSGQLLYGKKKDDMVKAISRFVEVVPQWGSMYAPSDATIIQAYQIILTQAKETATNGKPIETEYETENKKLSDMMGQSSDFKLGKIKAYGKAIDVYKHAGLEAPSFEDWFKNNGLQEYKTLLAAQAKQNQKVNTLLKAEGIASPLVEALAALNAEYEKATDFLSVPVTSNPGAELFFDWKNHKSDPDSFKLDNHSTHYDYSKDVWHSQSGTKLFGFISIGYREESGEQENILNTESTYNLEMKFDATAAPTIAQGKWFDGAVLREYKDGPWIAGSQFATNKAHPYGDAGAILPLVATRLYVVMNPAITITLDNKEFDSLYNTVTTHTSKGVNLGPFAFGGANTDNTDISQATKSSDTTQSFTVKDTSGIPQVIAVANQKMP